MNHSSYLWIFLGDNVDEFVVVNNSVSVLISIVDHLINFSNWEILSDWSSHLFEFFWTESTLVFDVEAFEELSKWCLAVSISAESEDFEEATEVHLFRVRWSLNNTEDLLSLVFNAEGSDSVDQFFTRDVSTSVVVEDIEAFLKLDNSVLTEVLVGVFLGVELD